MRNLFVIAVAVAVPIVWSLVFLQTPGELVLALPITFTSVVFWSIAVRFLVRPRSLTARLGAGLLLGAVSPFLCAVLMALLLLPMWPLFLIAAGHALAIPFVLLPFVLHEWPAFVPVGAGTGLVIGLLACWPPPAVGHGTVAPAR